MKCDMVTKPTGRRRGRPHLRLRDDPERYWIARFLAECDLKGPGMTDRGIALMMTAVRYGEVANDSENVKNLVTASGAVAFKYAKGDVRYPSGTVRGEEDRKQPRYRSAFHPRADDLLRKARRLWSGHDADDCKWLVVMREAWVQALSGPEFKASLLAASSLCLFAGETPFFHRVIGPIIEARFGLRPASGFTAPEFNPYDAA